MDALCNMSGIFRDSFQNVVELLDDLFRRAGEADEPDACNFVRWGATLSGGEVQKPSTWSGVQGLGFRGLGFRGLGFRV